MSCSYSLHFMHTCCSFGCLTAISNHNSIGTKQYVSHFRVCSCLHSTSMFSVESQCAVTLTLPRCQTALDNNLEVCDNSPCIAIHACYQPAVVAMRRPCRQQQKLSRLPVSPSRDFSTARSTTQRTNTARIYMPGVVSSSVPPFSEGERERAF